MLDYLVIGAGPAGLQLAYYLRECRRDVVVFERGDTPGAFFREFPRHRQLISINKLYTGYTEDETNLRWDWNSLLGDGAPRLKEFSSEFFPPADALVDYLRTFQQRYDLPVVCNTEVRELRKDGAHFTVVAGEDAYQARRVIVATGLFTPFLPKIPGIEHAESYDRVSVAPEDFVDQRVLILGKGNSAFETADALTHVARCIHLCSPHSLRFAWQTHYVGDLRAVNNNFLDTYQLKSQNAVLDATIERIEHRARHTEHDAGGAWESDADFRVSVAYQHADGEKEVLYYDRIIACTGFRFDASMFGPGAQPETTIKLSSDAWEPGKYPAQTEEYESTNVADLFFAGTLMAARDFKRTTSAFIHGFRYNVEALSRILEQRYHQRPWPSREVGRDAVSLAATLLERVNRDSAMWQQFGYIGDVFRLTSGDRAYLYERVPLDFWEAGKLFPFDGSTVTCGTLTLEYGAEHPPDPFRVERTHREDAEHADQSHFLHPVVRLYDGDGTLRATHHVIEDLLSEWKESVHQEPLEAFLARELRPETNERAELETTAAFETQRR